MTLHITYDPVNGTPIEDGRVMDTVKEWFENRVSHVNISSMFVLFAIFKYGGEINFPEEDVKLFFRPVRLDSGRMADLIEIDLKAEDRDLPIEFRKHMNSLMAGMFEE